MRLKLTDRIVMGLRPQDARYDVADALQRGLQLRVGPDGRRTWSVVLRASGRVRRVTLGEYGEGAGRLTLRRARDAAADVVAKARKGKPLPKRQLSGNPMTLPKLGELYIEGRPSLAASTRYNYECYVERMRNHPLGKVDAADVSTEDLERFLREVHKGQVGVVRAWEFWRWTLKRAVRRGLLERDPGLLIDRPYPVRSRERVLSDDEVKRLLLAARAAGPETETAITLGVLSAQRPGEWGGMRGEELDLERGEWTIPAERRKNRRLHVVPLAPPLVELLRPWKDKRGILFPAWSRGHYVKKRDVVVSWPKLLAAAGIEGVRPHDLRRTAATGMARMGTPQFVVARVLGHAEKGVTQVYVRYEWMREKREALDGWATHITSLLKS